MSTVSAFALVALLWGATNPWLKRASERHGDLSMPYLLLHLDYLLPLLLNLSGSVAFYWLLGDAGMHKYPSIKCFNFNLLSLLWFSV